MHLYISLLSEWLRWRHSVRCLWKVPICIGKKLLDSFIFLFIFYKQRFRVSHIFSLIEIHNLGSAALYLCISLCEVVTQHHIKWAKANAMCRACAVTITQAMSSVTFKLKMFWPWESVVWGSFFFFVRCWIGKDKWMHHFHDRHNCPACSSTLKHFT